MAKVMFRKNSAGELVFYLPKKDLEEVVVTLEHNGEEGDTWGGELELSDGSRYYVDPIPSPSLPITIKAKRL